MKKSHVKRKGKNNVAPFLERMMHKRKKGTKRSTKRQRKG
jgi:hypothetical protein